MEWNGIAFNNCHLCVLLCCDVMCRRKREKEKVLVAGDIIIAIAIAIVASTQEAAKSLNIQYQRIIHSYYN